MTTDEIEIRDRRARALTSEEIHRLTLDKEVCYAYESGSKVAVLSSPKKLRVEDHFLILTIEFPSASSILSGRFVLCLVWYDPTYLLFR